MWRLRWYCQRVASTVGLPTVERALTDLLGQHAATMIDVRDSDRLLYLPEVPFPGGRPDGLLIVVSSAGLAERRRAGLRLASLTHAQILESHLTVTPSGYSPSWVARVSKQLRADGWLTRDHRARPVGRLIQASLAVEAKMSDWRRGVRQLCRTRWMVNMAALLLPSEVQHRASRTLLRHNRIGLIVAHGDSLRWQVTAPNMALRPAGDLWLSELAARALEGECVQTTGQTDRRSA